jgi:hypothetical protein
MHQASRPVVRDASRTRLPRPAQPDKESSNLDDWEAAGRRLADLVGRRLGTQAVVRQHRPADDVLEGIVT